MAISFMNFLAHLYLSGPSEKVLVGNFIADFVKGKQIHSFDEEIVEGILLHRKIDHFTDTHPLVAKSKQKLREKYRHYSGVLVDVFYDHFLARNWKDYSSVSLVQFANNFYNTIRKYDQVLPERVLHMLPVMISNNWLVAYASFEGIEKVLQGMSRRTTFTSHMDEALIDLKMHYDEFYEEFSLFFPELVAHSLK